VIATLAAGLAASDIFWQRRQGLGTAYFSALMADTQTMTLMNKKAVL